MKNDISTMWTEILKEGRDLLSHPNLDKEGSHLGVPVIKKFTNHFAIQLAGYKKDNFKITEENGLIFVFFNNELGTDFPGTLYKDFRLTAPDDWNLGSLSASMKDGILYLQAELKETNKEEKREINVE